MPLSPGTRLGPYEVLSLLGAGGMGEVYRARDTTLNREVALKVLSPALAADAAYMARFQREAQLLASLNHPHIAILHGLETSGETRALVMELVEGDTLADRIRVSPIPLEEALPIARQIAEALEAAHERGIVHRDLKPANVKVTPDGTVKVLDFGLAKALDDEPSTTPAGLNSPTLTMAATRAGVILGTAAYMPPEQAKGKRVDKRADIWAFGVVLFEMLTGKQVHSAETIPETLASVMRDDPRWETLPANTPPAIHRLLRRCLDKDPKRRLRDIGEARIALDDSAGDTGALLSPARLDRQPKPWTTRLSWALAALATLAALALAFAHLRETPPSERVLRYLIPAPEKSVVHSFAISPDGRYLAMAAIRQGKHELWVRALDAVQAQLLPSTEGATFPFWSPDSSYIGFFIPGKLKKIAVSGGPAQTLCDALSGRGGTWNRDGVIVFAPTGSGALLRVPAAGGVPAHATQVKGAALHRFPIFLPDGRRFLYSVNRAGPEESGVHLGSLDSLLGRRLLPESSSFAWVPPQPGSRNSHLLFLRENTLMAQPLDPKTMDPVGNLFPVAEQVSFGDVLNFAPISTSDNGILVYQVGRSAGESQLAWYDRGGKELAKVGAAARMTHFALSPDEKTAAIPRSSGTNSDIWLHEMARDNDTRFTSNGSPSMAPVWSPDGSRLIFVSFRNGPADLYQKDTGGAGQDELLFQSKSSKYPTDWSRDGRFLLFVNTGAKTNWDLWVLPLTGDRKPVPFLETEFNEAQGQFSPDGNWVAYASDESGRYEIYVRPFPSGSAKWKISIAGGQLPRWRRDGKELFFLGEDQKLMAVLVKAVPGPRPVFEPATPQALFDAHTVPIPAGFNWFPYAVSSDGKRFLLNTIRGESAEMPLTVVTNWLAAVKK